MMASFSFAATPHLHFGVGKRNVLPDLIRPYGKNVLLITGTHSLLSSDIGKQLMAKLISDSVGHITIDKEPTPSMIDDATRRYRSGSPRVVIAIGGGSVLDAGKAISAMLTVTDPVREFLEGVGSKNHPGRKVSFIAVPTTAGTGSEATKNAVLSEVGEHGYKKSLRHNNFVPDVAVVDPELSITCSPAVTASSGMDAFTQLLESYVSSAANPMTDALALEGLKKIATSLIQAYRDGSDLQARSGMALAAYLSGITLANAGLGVVHGFASSVGGYYEIPHGVICSSLMSSANTVAVKKMRKNGVGESTLIKYAEAGKLFSGLSGKSNDYYIDYLLSHIAEMSDEMKIPKLSNWINARDYARIVNATDNKNNPVLLTKEELTEVLHNAYK